MTDKELAEESLISYRKEPKWAGKMFMQDENTCYKDGFLAGLKAHLLQWYTPEEKLPKDCTTVLAIDNLEDGLVVAIEHDGWESDVPDNIPIKQFLKEYVK